jgi:exodeoxyribonuclease VIII
VFVTYGGKRPIDGIVWDDAYRVQRTIFEHAEGMAYLTNGLPEVAIIARCPLTGMMLKVKFDWRRFDDTAADVKTTLSAKPDDFRRQIYKLHYDLQEAFYTYVASLRGIHLTEFAFVAVEYIHADICQPYVLARKRKLKAMAQLHSALADFKECQSSDRWYGYQKEVLTIMLD